MESMWIAATALKFSIISYQVIGDGLRFHILIARRRFDPCLISGFLGLLATNMKFVAEFDQSSRASITNSSAIRLETWSDVEIGIVTLIYTENAETKALFDAITRHKPRVQSSWCSPFATSSRFTIIGTTVLYFGSP